MLGSAPEIDTGGESARGLPPSLAVAVDLERELGPVLTQKLAHLLSPLLSLEDILNQELREKLDHHLPTCSP